MISVKECKFRTMAALHPPARADAVRRLLDRPRLQRVLQQFFPAGQPFGLWADAVVDDQTVRGEGRLGDGAILGQESAAGEAPRTAARPALTCCQTVPRPRLGALALPMAGQQ